MPVDLHTHSTVSDGSDTPEGLVDLAVAAGLSAFALTDHDRLDGLRPAAARAAESGVELVPGCELSCAVERGTLHLLVYFVSDDGGALATELVRLQAIREDRNALMVERLRALGLPVSAEELEAEAGGVGAGRPHLAALLVRHGVVATIKEAFDVWLARGRPGYVEKERLTAARAIELALEAGALPVLAHPLSLELEPAALEAAVAELGQLGLVGIEAIYGRYSPVDRAGLVALADGLGLVATGGSDHHGTYKPDLAVGVGQGDLDVPDATLAALRDRLP